MTSMSSLIPHDLARRIHDAGYYPDLVEDTLSVALADEEPLSHLVHNETTFDMDTVRRHLSVLVLTRTRLVLVHVDDHSPVALAEAGLGDLALVDDRGMPGDTASPHAVAVSEAIPLRSVGAVGITHVVADPAHYQRGELGRDVTLTIAWGTVSRVDLEPATCGDPHCENDHGYSGAITSDDLSLRIAADADGPEAVADAVAFARAVSAATAQ